MKIFGYEIRRAKEKRSTPMPTFNTQTTLLSKDQPMLLSTVYRCVDLIGNDVAQLPLRVFRIDKEGYKTPFVNHPSYRLLNEEPNSDMTRFTFIKTLVSSVMLTGNGYAYIHRQGSKLVELQFLHSSLVTPVKVPIGNDEYVLRYRVAGMVDLVEPKDMIHILNYSYDGVVGVSTLTHARQTLRISTDSEQHAANFFEGGASVNGVMTIEGTRLTSKQKEENYEEWNRRLDPYTGNGGLVILEGNMKYQPITINPKDAQMLETRQFNVLDICRFFSVSPVKAFDLSKSSYSTIEATQIDHLTGTINPWLVKIELELKRKLFFDSEKSQVEVKFDTKAMLRADSSAQATYLNSLFQIGSMTPNEIRRDLDMGRIENGDQSFVQVNVQTLDQAVNKDLSDKNMVTNKEQE